jgi:hypothetical protein
MNVTRDRSCPYPSLVDALRLLPNIRPVCERHRLGEAKHHASLSPDRTASVNGVSVTLGELEELFLESERGSPRISQAGAALLLRLFEQGAFDFFECRPVEGGVDLLTQYAKGLATLIEPRFWGSARRQQPVAPTKSVKRKKVPAREVSIAREPAELIGTVHRLI